MQRAGWDLLRRRAIGIAAGALLACAPTSRMEPPAAETRSPSPRAAPAPPGTASPASLEPVGRFSTGRAMRHVRALAGRIGPRPGGSGAYQRAARYAARALRAHAWRVEIDPFRLPQGGRSANVIATWGASGGRALLVGAHLDTVEGSPGANDNASGVAVLVETARALAGTRFARGVVLVGFGAEERQPNGSHHLGSERYVRQSVAGRRPRPRAMLSVDMIGKHSPLIVGWVGSGSRTAVAAALRAATGAGVAADDEVLGDVSDHVPFARIGVPAALLWTGLEPNYHSPGDVVSNVDPPALRNAGAVVIGVVRRLVRR